MIEVVEILLYTLSPGSGAGFHSIMQDVSVPLHRSVGMDVVLFGQSLDRPDCYYLMRAYDDLEHLENSQRKFYESDLWRNGPRAEIIECIKDSLKSVVPMTTDAIDALRLRAD